jgi:hypothetical protein
MSTASEASENMEVHQPVRLYKVRNNGHIAKQPPPPNISTQKVGNINYYIIKR